MSQVTLSVPQLRKSSAQREPEITVTSPDCDVLEEAVYFPGLELQVNKWKVSADTGDYFEVPQYLYEACRHECLCEYI